MELTNQQLIKKFSKALFLYKLILPLFSLPNVVKEFVIPSKFRVGLCYYFDIRYFGPSYVIIEILLKVRNADRSKYGTPLLQGIMKRHWFPIMEYNGHVKRIELLTDAIAYLKTQ